ncbi:c-type cytochrome domain-containing protein [Reichenbachiella sp.]|uniref:c-type cytochrome domain-containing protein n=1 Tax=Reichenbachiella sp. TaxID=2184521 RepID=UPI003BAE2584
MNVPDIVVFLGRFHPLVVHLPIGILLLAFLMWSYDFWKKSTAFSQAIAFSLLLGTLGAAASCLIGYMLSLSGGYSDQALNWHMWAGIATTALAAWAYLSFTLKLKSNKNEHIRWASLTLMVIVLSITGHLGGNLTHGSDYLTEYAPIIGERANQLPLPRQVEAAMVYDHIAKPIIQAKCVSCHSDEKKKGGLSMVDAASMMRGGDSGSLFAQPFTENEVLRRIHLSESDEDVMPPKGKTQLTEEEKKILAFWLKHSGAFGLALDSIGNDSINHLAAVYLGLAQGGYDQAQMIALDSVPRATIENLITEGVVIRELVAGSNSYDVRIPSSVGHDKGIELLKKLEPLFENIIWLHLSGLGLKDEELTSVETMDNLVKLRLDNNDLTDEGIKVLSNMKSLEVLNVYGNTLTDSCLVNLSDVKNLKTVYAWKTGITAPRLGKVMLIGAESSIE